MIQYSSGERLEGAMLKAVLDALFVVAVAYAMFVVGFRLYWRWKVSRMKGTAIPPVKGEIARLKRGKGVIYFYSPKCKPCRLTEPVVKKLSKEMKGVKFVKVNVLENSDTARAFGILATPSFVITKNGYIEDVLAGAVSEKVLREKLS
jgi:thioredoxin 1